MDNSSPITFVDVETTGLSHEDRVVSLGIVHFSDQRMLSSSNPSPQVEHLIFNPGRASDPRARKVHGYSDEALAMQELFSVHADGLRDFFIHDGVVVAHNASFDRRFIAKEFKAAKIKGTDRDFFCTMLAHRKQYGSRSGLDAVLQQMGHPARTARHGALHDAWLAGQVYCWLHGLKPLDPMDTSNDIPRNYRDKQGVSAQPSPAVLSAPVSSTETEAFAEAKSKLKPMAVLMMAIARADGSFSMSEVETMSLFINSRLDTEGIMLDGDEYLDLLDFLCGHDAGMSLEAACRKVMETPVDRNELAGWIRQITYADGGGSPSEQAVIESIVTYARAGSRS